MPEIDLVKQVAAELKLQDYQVHNTISLLIDEEATVPFIARYRKERTGTLDEVQIRDIRDRYQYLDELIATKARYWAVITEQAAAKPEIAAKLPKLKEQFARVQTKQELEDLYLPFKPKRRTKAQVAREKGLDRLLDTIWDRRESLGDLETCASEFLTAQKQEEREPDAPFAVNAVEALAGAADIFAERVAETPEFRAQVREQSFATAFLVAKKIERADPKTAESLPAGATAEKSETADSSKAPKGGKNAKKDKSAKYQNYFDYREPIAQAPSHRIMAVRRGESEKVLKVLVEVDRDRIIANLNTAVLGDKVCDDHVKLWLETAIGECYRRLLQPAIETEIRLELKRRAESEAIAVFAKNLENLLLLPPIPETTVLGVDPGLRTGSKLAVVSNTGKLLAHATVHPDPRKSESPKTKTATDTIGALMVEHKVQYVAIGNGTGSREIDQVVRSAMKARDLGNCRRLVVNEAGASVYSTDKVAREEFPDLDATIRSAVSIARRLQDPLAELVKIDPRSIGVGQYQHDVNVTKLNQSLGEVVESCVNRVGVNLNTASHKLLAYVSGIGPALAKSIVQFRDEHGEFRSRKSMLEVQGCGSKAFELAAGFLRVPGAENPLDNSAVHPESYETVEKMAATSGKPLSEIIGRDEIIDSLPLEQFVTADIGLPSLRDIVSELKKPGRDPRTEGSRLQYNEDVCAIEDLELEMELSGTVTNVTNFGAFVDIGVHQDGLVHISELSTDFVKDAAAVVSVGDVLKVRVIEVDQARNRISLSCRPAGAKREPTQGGERQQPRSAASANRRGGAGSQERSAGGQRHQPKANQGGRGRAPNRGQRERQPEKHYTLEDLVNKFNVKRS